MGAAVVFSLVLQQLSVAPYPCETGGEVVVRAVEPAGPVAALPIVLELGDGGRRELGRTDAAGELRFEAGAPGLVAVSADRAGVRWVAPLQVIAPPPRWLYALVCVPLGLLLLIRNLRRRATGSAAAS